MRVRGQVAQVGPADPHRALVGIVKSRDQRQDRGFSGARRPDDGRGLTGGGAQVDAVQDRLAVQCDPHVVQRDVRSRGGKIAARRQAGCVEDRDGPADRAVQRLDDREQGRQRLDRFKVAHHDHAERHRLDRADPAGPQQRGDGAEQRHHGQLRHDGKQQGAGHAEAQQPHGRAALAADGAGDRTAKPAAPGRTQQRLVARELFAALADLAPGGGEIGFRPAHHPRAKTHRAEQHRPQQQRHEPERPAGEQQARRQQPRHQQVDADLGREVHEPGEQLHPGAGQGAPRLGLPMGREPAGRGGEQCADQPGVDGRHGGQPDVEGQDTHPTLDHPAGRHRRQKRAQPREAKRGVGEERGEERQKQQRRTGAQGRRQRDPAPERPHLGPGLGTDDPAQLHGMVSRRDRPAVHRSA